MNLSQREELSFLRFFYREVEGALGPASDDIYQMIKDAYEEAGYNLPENYSIKEDEDG